MQIFKISSVTLQPLPSYHSHQISSEYEWIRQKSKDLGKVDGRRLQMTAHPVNPQTLIFRLFRLSNLDFHPLSTKLMVSSQNQSIYSGSFTVRAATGFPVIYEHSHRQTDTQRWQWYQKQHHAEDSHRQTDTQRWQWYQNQHHAEDSHRQTDTQRWQWYQNQHHAEAK